MAGDRTPATDEDPSALRQRLAVELAHAVVRAEKRLGRALDRAELARRLNVSPSSLYAYLNGTTLAGVGVFDELLVALGVGGPEAGRLSTLRDRAEAARRLRPAAARATVGTSGPPPSSRVPHQLPPSLRNFVGREPELRRLDGLLEPDPVAAVRPVVITSIEGTAGVGKTSLALHWARRVEEHFPDGQLHLNLRGFDSGVPMSPAEALHDLLQSLGVTPDAIPARVTAAAGLLRTVLAGRRVVVVLDNARSADQVRPLLPGGPGSLVIVTSRNRLDGLVVRDGAFRVTLDVLPRYAARALVEGQIGADRLADEPRAADELVDLCARLPLALSVAGARAALEPKGSIGLFVARLRQANARLGILELKDADVNLRSVFQGSYALLPPPVARLFRLLGCHPGPDLDATACAALLGEQAPPDELLDALTAAHLVRQYAPGRYVLHDLLRLYAKELADDGPAAERATAVERLLRHYLSAARLADRRLEPWRRAPVEPTGTEPPVENHAAAMAWFEAELGTLQAVIALAARSEGLESYTWRLAQACAVYLRRSGRRFQRGLVHEIARDAAAKAGDRRAWASATRRLADALSRLDRSDEALSLLYEALRECRRLGDDDGARQVRLSLVRVYAARGDHRRALPQARLALAMAERTADPLPLADGLSALAQEQERSGDHAAALVHGRRAFDLYAELGHLDGQAAILLTTGRAEQSSGRHAAAIGTYERSLALDRAVGDRYREAHALDHLADAHAALGHDRDAYALRREALDVLRTLHHPDAARISAKLPDAPISQ
ncbi:ATP-binding protein [Streptomyces sp. NPDC093221]|uniref:ATP-binding protein n=1 Tax=Streptomyces sp. NPDC093221 TaxID=3366032 RepID=UPI0037F70877